MYAHAGTDVSSGMFLGYLSRMKTQLPGKLDTMKQIYLPSCCITRVESIDTGAILRKIEVAVLVSL